MGLLKFDEPVMKTDLAEKYLDTWTRDPIMKCEAKKGVPPNVLLRRLAKKVVENTDLFCQLEYLLRNTPADVTRSNIKLIEQNLLHDHSRTFVATDCLFISGDIPIMHHKQPLAALGLVAQYLSANLITTMIWTESSSQICHLFAKLCCDVGFGVEEKRTPKGRRWYWVYTENPRFVKLGEPSDEVDVDKELDAMAKVEESQLSLECTGVIMERSDLDSAVDAFLASNSSSQCPWGLRRILVQESVYEQFKKAIDWKCKLKTPSVTSAGEGLCTETLVYGDKCILLDYAGPEHAVPRDGPRKVFVEAFRTNKELLSLVASHGARVMSLWSSDMAEANEIAYGADSSLVWVNDYGHFDGPPATSQWFYSFYFNDNSTWLDKKQLDLWKKYDNQTRLNIIFEALEKQPNVPNIDILKIQQNILKFRNNKTIYEDKGRVWIILDLPVNSPVHIWHVSDDVQVCVDFIEQLVNGNAVYLGVDGAEHYLPLLTLLRNAGVPILQLHAKKLYRPCMCYRSKAILTNFGTVFAN